MMKVGGEKPPAPQEMISANADQRELDAEGVSGASQIWDFCEFGKDLFKNQEDL